MAHQVIWTNSVKEFFYKEGNLSEFQIQIMETRIKGMSIIEQSMKFCCSKSLIDKEIKKLKAIYDECQKANPDKLPPRKFSTKELYMDSH